MLAFAGLRIGEALGLRWRDVVLARAAGRPARVRGGGSRSPADARIFGTRIGEAQSQEQRPQPRARSVDQGGERAARERRLDGVTPHALRRTFASILVALGRNPAVVMRQMGHTTPHMTLGVYAAAMD